MSTCLTTAKPPDPGTLVRGCTPCPADRHADPSKSKESLSQQNRTGPQRDAFDQWLKWSKEPTRYQDPNTLAVYNALRNRIDRAEFKEQLDAAGRDVDAYLTYLSRASPYWSEKGSEADAIEAVKEGVVELIKGELKPKWLKILTSTAGALLAELAKDGLTEAKIKFVEKAFLEALYAALGASFGKFYGHAAKALREDKAAEFWEAMKELASDLEADLTDYRGIIAATIRTLYQQNIITTTREAAAVRRFLLFVLNRYAQIADSSVGFLKSGWWYALRIALTSANTAHSEFGSLVSSLRERLRRRYLVWAALHDGNTEDHWHYNWPRIPDENMPAQPDSGS